VVQPIWVILIVIVVVLTFFFLVSDNSPFSKDLKESIRRLYSFFLPQVQATYVKYVFSLFLDVIAGYGYKPMRTLCWYLAVVIGFATIYSYIGQGQIPQLPNLDPLVLSIVSFHGRGFFPSLGDSQHPLTLHSPIAVLGALEAVIWLVIEISFIATFTQRFFGK